MDQGNLAYPYLKAIDNTGLGVRIMPIGLALFDRAPWNGVPHVFMSALRTRYINVVCAPPGVRLGAAITAAQFADNSQGGDKVVYEPDTMISGLLTVGIPNVAIVDGEGDFSEKELKALCLYDRVICPTPEGTTALCKQGVPSATVEPNPSKLSSLFSGITPV